MPYLKIRLDSILCEKDRFYRTLLVKKDLELYSFGIAIAQSFRALLYHTFTFESKKTSYYPPFFDENDGIDKSMDDYKVKDLDNEFKYCYDLGECWEFNGKIDKKEINEIYLDEFNEEKEVVLIDGAGQGIWEDNKDTLVKYFNGEIDPNRIRNSSIKGIYKPINFKIKKFGDFDTAFNLKKEKKEFYKLYLYAKSKIFEGTNKEYYQINAEI